MLCLVSECVDKLAKYKCPTCKLPYCSVECWRVHRNSECNEDSGKSTLSKDPEPTYIQEYFTEETVPQKKLALLGELPFKEHVHGILQIGHQKEFHEKSEGLKAVLQNPHLRDIILAVDSAANPVAAMQAAMTEPIFVEFADECLKVVDPEEECELN